MTLPLDELMQESLTEDDLDEVGRTLRHTGIHYELDEGRLILISPRKAWHADPDAERHDPGDFTLVVEVVSADSEHEDRVVKAGLYAGAGIPEYWIADRHPSARRDAVIEFFRLGPSGGYERTGEAVLSELEEKYGTR